MGRRRSYPVELTVNGIKLSEVVIDPHYEQRHSQTMNDRLILELVMLLNGQFYRPEARQSGYRYFAVDPLELGGAKYRLVWLLEQGKHYLGVINAFRR